MHFASTSEGRSHQVFLLESWDKHRWNVMMEQYYYARVEPYDMSIRVFFFFSHMYIRLNVYHITPLHNHHCLSRSLEFTLISFRYILSIFIDLTPKLYGVCSNFFVILNDFMVLKYKTQVTYGHRWSLCNEQGKQEITEQSNSEIWTK